MGGHITLTHPVITQLGVYRVHLYHLPLTIIKSLYRIMEKFIWSCMINKNKFHLIKLYHITLPKHMGGWGILNLRRFGWALLLKSMWRRIFGNGIWGMTIRHKYQKNHDFSLWMRRGCIRTTSSLAIWLSVTKTRKCFL